MKGVPLQRLVADAYRRLGWQVHQTRSAAMQQRGGKWFSGGSNDIFGCFDGIARDVARRSGIDWWQTTTIGAASVRKRKIESLARLWSMSENENVLVYAYQSIPGKSGTIVVYRYAYGRAWARIEADEYPVAAEAMRLLAEQRAARRAKKRGKNPAPSATSER